MTWLLFALLTALTESFKDVTGKLGLRRVDEFVVTSVMSGVAALLILPLLFFIEIPELGRRFFVLLALATSLFSLSLFLYFRAIRIADLSLAVPLVMYSPLFMLFISPLLLGEMPTPLGSVGVLLIVIGSYVLNVSSRNVGPLAPLKAILVNPGSRLMLIVALIWSVTANIDKLGMRESSPLFWGLAHSLATTIICSGYTLLRRRPDRTAVRDSLRPLVILGMLHGVHIVCYMITMHLALAVYAISMKRLSVLFSVVLGRLLFNERGLRERLTGAVIMLCGVLAILFSKA